MRTSEADHSMVGSITPAVRPNARRLDVSKAGKECVSGGSRHGTQTQPHSRIIFITARKCISVIAVP